MSNKSGASSRAIALPNGGGALHGIGEKFSPDLHTGYHHGYRDGTEREFRGFGTAEQLDTETFADYHAAESGPLFTLLNITGVLFHGCDRRR